MSEQDIANDEARAAAFDQFITQQQSMKKSVFQLDSDAAANVEVIPTGAVSLDVALGVGGIPRGRIIELYGPYSSGKTSLSLSIAAEAQKIGLPVGFVDAEHAMSRDHAETYGVDLSKMAVYQPDSGNDGLDMAISMAESGAFGLIIVDSVAALTPKEELEGSMEDMQVGAQARMMAKGLRKITAAANRTQTAVIFINQIRMKIGVMFGNPEDTPGGRALKFYCSVRMEVRSAAGARITASGKKTDTPIGQTCTVSVRKNKVAPPHRKAEFDIYYESGVDVASGLVNAGKELGVIFNRGSSYYRAGDDENRIAVGAANLLTEINENPELRDSLMTDIYRALKGLPPLSMAGDESKDESEVEKAA